MPFFYDYSLVYFWVLLSGCFALLELTTPGLFACLAFAGGCLVSAVSTLFTPDTSIQTAVGLLASIIFFWILKTYLKNLKFSHTTSTHPNSNIHALLGKDVYVEQELGPDQTGYARVEREIWSCKNGGTTTLSAHGVARIVSIQGNTLIIKSKE